MGTVNTSEESVSDSVGTYTESEAAAAAATKVTFALAGEVISSSFSINPMILGRSKSPSSPANSSLPPSPSTESLQGGGEAEFDIHHFRASLDLKYRRGLDSHIDSLLNENRMVDRRTIRELVAEINTLTARIESLQGFSGFVEDSFDLEETPLQTDASPSNDNFLENSMSDGQKTFPSKNDNDERTSKAVLLMKSSTRTEESIIGLFWAFLWGALFMLFCVYFDNIRSSIR